MSEHQEFKPGQWVLTKHREAKYHGRRGMVLEKRGRHSYKVELEPRQRKVHRPSAGAMRLVLDTDPLTHQYYSANALTLDARQTR